VKVKFIEKGVINGKAGFKVKFANNFILYLILKNDQLKVTDRARKYLKYFAWKYEGSVNGIGAFCKP
jgi:hypothetical protein